MLVTYAPPIPSISHAVLPQSVVVFLDIPSHCRRIVFRCTHTYNSSVHSFAASRASLRCIVFCFYRAVGVGVVVVAVSYWSAAPTCTSSSLPLHDLLPFLSPPTNPCCLPISARLPVPPHCITLFSFTTLRRASRLKPPNIYYSSSPPLHCKIYTFPHRSYTLPTPLHDRGRPFHPIQCSN